MFSIYSCVIIQYTWRNKIKILTLDNEAYDLDHLPEEIDDMRFSILDNSNPQDPDYHYIPLIFLESFNSPALVLRIGDHKVRMPVDWQLLIGEPDFGDLEVIPLSALNDRGFKAFQFNPLTSFRPSFLDVDLHYLFLRHVKQEVERLSCCLVNTNEGLKQEQNVINRRMWIVRVHEIV